MCGYFGNLHECPEVIVILNELGIQLPFPTGQYYQRRLIDSLVTSDQTGYSAGDAMWWFVLKWESEQWKVNSKVTSFNARNLSSPLWKGPMQSRRAVVFASEIGESKSGAHYLMRSKSGLALGAVYRDWLSPTGKAIRSMAIITRPPHSRFSRYHTQSIPCFLPLDANIIKHWLDPKIKTSPLIESLLAEQKIYQDLEVTQVKSFKRGEPLGNVEILEKD